MSAADPSISTPESRPMDDSLPKRKRKTTRTKKSKGVSGDGEEEEGEGEASVQERKQAEEQQICELAVRKTIFVFTTHPKVTCLGCHFYQLNIARKACCSLLCHVTRLLHLPQTSSSDTSTRRGGRNVAGVSLPSFSHTTRSALASSGLDWSGDPRF